MIKIFRQCLGRNRAVHGDQIRACDKQDNCFEVGCEIVRERLESGRNCMARHRAQTQRIPIRLCFRHDVCADGAIRFFFFFFFFFFFLFLCAHHFFTTQRYTYSFHTFSEAKIFQMAHF